MTSAGENVQPELDGMPARLFSATPTRLDMWLSCPRKYRMNYLDSPKLPKGPPRAATTMGIAVHNALKDWWKLELAARTPDSGGSLVRANWRDDGFRDDEQSQGALARAVAWVQGYLSRVNPEFEPRGVERTVSFTTDHLSLQGRVDRIDERGDELVIVDYKTGRHPLNEAEAASSLALAIYASGAERTLRKTCVQVELHHLPTGEVQVHRHTPESRARHIARADQIGLEAATAQREFKKNPEELDVIFPPTPSSLCGYCDFAQHCDAFTGTPALPWAGIDLTE